MCTVIMCIYKPSTELIVNYTFFSEGIEKALPIAEKRERLPFPKQPLNPNVRWHLICVDMDDWEGLAELLKDSKVKCERDLYKCIVEDFLPAIPDIIEARVSLCCVHRFVL